MARAVLVVVGGLAGFILGGAAGFGTALAVAKPRYDGTFAMREMLVCVPVAAAAGAIIGIIAAIKLAS